MCGVFASKVNQVHPNVNVRFHVSFLLFLCSLPADVELLDIIVVVVSPLVNLERSIYKAGKYWYSCCNAQ